MKPTIENELVGTIAELWTIFPEWRFGQMIASLTMAAGRLTQELSTTSKTRNCSPQRVALSKETARGKP